VTTAVNKPHPFSWIKTWMWHVCFLLLIVFVCVCVLQRYIQAVLVVIAVICIPWMLCVKPFYLLAKHKRKPRVRWLACLRIPVHI